MQKNFYRVKCPLKIKLKVPKKELSQQITAKRQNDDYKSRHMS